MTDAASTVNEPWAVVFDVDGVLVDSYDAHLESWRRLAAETGVEFTEEDFAATFGRTSREIIRLHWDGSLDDDEVRRLDDRKEALYREIVRSDFPVMPGAVALIDDLIAAGCALGVGSSGPRENVILALARLGRAGAFGAVITGEDVNRGKPDPEVYARACESLRIPPRRCVVVEDAPAGVESARRAGARAVALLSRGRAAADFTDTPPHSTVERLSDLSARRLAEVANG